MILLSIETSCDETAISLVKVFGGLKNPQVEVLSDITISQIKIHQKYGGVFPNLAKREHSRNLIPIIQKVLEQGFGISKPKSLIPEQALNPKIQKRIEKILEREPELLEQFLKFIPLIKKPSVDKIIVTYGPGLEPALWVGINFAKALSLVWNIPIIPANHMEGHIASVLLPQNRELKAILSFPTLALLISGGHTELVLIKKWGDYKVIGQTRDDAVGEVFDKVARMLSLPYPGGPEISRLATQARELGIMNYELKFPRPMITSPDLDFSFSGLKTAVLYHLQKYPAKMLEQKQEIAREFEDAVTEVLITKTKKAIQQYKIKSLIVGGGVSANKFLRENLKKELEDTVNIFIPSVELSTDNALMIAVAGYLKILTKKKISKTIKAEGNLSF